MVDIGGYTDYTGAEGLVSAKKGAMGTETSDTDTHNIRQTHNTGSDMI